MENDRVLVREPHELGVDAEAGEVSQAALALLLLAHARPDIGVEDVRAGSGFVRIGQKLDRRGARRGCLARQLDGLG